jgi:hypothetical protein
VRFWRGGAQQGFRHIGARLSESGINVGITDRTQLAAMMARVDLQPFN